MAYATVADVELRAGRTFAETETATVTALLEDAAVMIDAFNTAASNDAKRIVSCRMVVRAAGAESGSMFPVGSTQGSMGAGGYSQSWTIGSGGTTGELYLGRSDKALLGGGSLIGAHSPLEEMVPNV